MEIIYQKNDLHYIGISMWIGSDTGSHNVFQKGIIALASNGCPLQGEGYIESAKKLSDGNVGYFKEQK